MRLIKSTPKGKRRVYDIEVADVHNFYANGVNVHNCATDGGVSVIKDDGTVVDITASNIYKLTTNVLFDGEKIIWGWDGYSNLQRFIHVFNKIPSSDVNFSNGEYKGSADAFYGNTTLADMHIIGNEDSITKIVKYDIGLNNNPNQSVQNHGIIRIHPNYNSPSDGIFANITKDFNTGWMHGDIKGAFLSDTDATNVTGSELVTNGTFDTDTNGWTNYTGTGTFDSQRIRVTANSNGTNGYVYQSFSTISGKKYVLTADIIAGVNTINLFLGTAAAATNIYENGWSASTRSVRVEFTALTSTTFITLASHPSTTSYGLFDNISVKRIEEDRSVNNNGLQVFGTITKSAVATGAELVAYSDWSSSNYLRRPYISSIDNPGTGDYSIIFWAKCSVSHAGVIWSIRDPSNPSNNWMQLWFDNTNLTFLQTNGGTLQTTSVNYYNNQWNCYAIVKSSGIGYMYENGTLKTSVGMSGDPGLLSTCTYSIGVHYDNNYPVQGSLALLRYSLSAPSAEQIKKIYEDEKVLFQENAACTLYGSSDAVTALAYDDSNDLLHVGTSSGRSDFQGLRRINNTTTAVTTAISASNGLIAEQ